PFHAVSKPRSAGRHRPRPRDQGIRRQRRLRRERLLVPAAGACRVDVMKIWYQSASGYRYESVWDEYGRTLEAQCRNVLHRDTEVYVTGIPVMVRDVENWRSLQYYQNVQTLNNMRRAQREGYDAFVIGCTLDVGLPEGKSMLDIPVVGISE